MRTVLSKRSILIALFAAVSFAQPALAQKPIHGSSRGRPMNRFIAPLMVALTLSGGIYAAHAFGLGEGNRFGKHGSMSKAKKGSPPVTVGSALLVNNVDAALLVNNVDPACLVGGC